MNTPWIDKYRPNKLDDVVYQNDVITMLKNVIISGNLPHLLFYGGPGTGKTSTILALSKELFGSKYRDRVLELNASDERGINAVRNKVGTFAKLTINNMNNNMPPYKIIILDEADAMTTDAQSALRKTIEDNSSNTRFCFICNYINKIIDPIASRCVKIRFKPLNSESVVSKLKYISEKESLTISDNVLHTIFTQSNGDLRKAIMILQKCKYIKTTITDQDILDITNHIPYTIINSIITTCISDKFTKTDIINIHTQIKIKAYPVNNILNELLKKILCHKELSDKQKGTIILLLSDIEKCIIEGADEYIQLIYLLFQLKKITISKN